MSGGRHKNRNLHRKYYRFCEFCGDRLTIKGQIRFCSTKCSNIYGNGDQDWIVRVYPWWEVWRGRKRDIFEEVQERKVAKLKKIIYEGGKWREAEFYLVAGEYMDFLYPNGAIETQAAMLMDRDSPSYS